MTLALATVLSVLTASAAQAASAPAVISHRGYAGTGCTENTVCSFTAAAKHGADGVEMDVRFTSTGYPVISHDHSVWRTTGTHGWVDRHTVSWFTHLRTHDGGHPATLWGALHAAKQGGVTALVELKVNPTAKQWDHFIAKIPSGFRSHMTIQSFSSKAVWAARRHGFPMVRLLNYATTASWTWQYDSEAAPYQDLTAGGIAKLHAHGVPVYAWTVDDRAAWAPLTDKGVDAIITDANPATVKATIGGAR